MTRHDALNCDGENMREQTVMKLWREVRGSAGRGVMLRMIRMRDYENALNDGACWSRTRTNMHLG